MHSSQRNSRTGCTELIYGQENSQSVQVVNLGVALLPMTMVTFFHVALESTPALLRGETTLLGSGNSLHLVHAAALKQFGTLKISNRGNLSTSPESFATPTKFRKKSLKSLILNVLRKES